MPQPMAMQAHAHFNWSSILPLLQSIVICKKTLSFATLTNFFFQHNIVGVGQGILLKVLYFLMKFNVCSWTIQSFYTAHMWRMKLQPLN